MLKYYNAMVVFEEIPDEITLAINITNCPCKCPGCHSKFLWDDNGTELTVEVLHKLIKENDGITCVCFMGGDRDPEEIVKLSEYVNCIEHLNVGWYSGKDDFVSNLNYDFFEYVKIGHYDMNLGGLDSKTTNQRLYKKKINTSNGLNLPIWHDITSKFWK